MSRIAVDHSDYLARNEYQVDTHDQALWTFTILERSVSFWGRYHEAVTTAERYAHSHGLLDGTIRLVDCSGIVATVKH